MPGFQQIPALILQNKDYYASSVYEKLIEARSNGELNCLARAFIPTIAKNATSKQIHDLAQTTLLKQEGNWRNAEMVPVVGTFAAIRQAIFVLSMPSDIVTNKCAHMTRLFFSAIPIVGSIAGLPACICTGIEEDPS